jgi:hypothetical protein
MPIHNVRPFKVLVDGETWTETTSFAGTAPDNKVYTIDATGRIVFGDGTNGRRPNTGSQIVVTYRQGGGADGNLEISLTTQWPPKNSKFLVVIEDQSLKISPATEVESGSGLKRPSFFAGELLTADDLQAEQSYLRELRWLHNKHLHGFGIVSGLEVEVGGGNNFHVVVSPGFALDAYGRELILNKCVELQIGTQQSPKFVTLEHNERGTDWIPSTTGGQKIPSRIEDCVLVTLLDEPQESGALTIARVVNTSSGWNVDSSFQPMVNRLKR